MKERSSLILKKGNNKLVVWLAVKGFDRRLLFSKLIKILFSYNKGKISKKSKVGVGAEV